MVATAFPEGAARGVDAVPAVPGREPTAAARARPRALALWLVGVAALVFCMVVIGGITRLTESGLSIVRWEPVSGVVPPLSENAWAEEFDAYRAYPEYRKVNRGMSLSEFKSIYMWEYIHRLLGRLIGLAFAVPLAWFVARRMVPPGYGRRLVLLFCFGGLQGVVGWWMVKSGLVDRPDVAHTRLAVHLLLAFGIYAALIWTALDFFALARRQISAVARGGAAEGVRMPERGSHPWRWVAPVLLLSTVQIGLGALTAGLDAGYAFNSWPKMGETWVPPGLETLAPAWQNLIDNPIAVQFGHRTMAMLVTAVVLGFAWSLWRAGGGGRPRALVVAAAVGLQFLLGVLTLVHGVPIVLGVLHQAGAAVLLASLIVAGHWAVRERAVRQGAEGSTREGAAPGRLMQDAAHGR